jgi:hypothetical protein
VRTRTSAIETFPREGILDDGLHISLRRDAGDYISVSVGASRNSRGATELLDTQAGDGPGDDQLLDFTGPLKNRVAHLHRVCE